MSVAPHIRENVSLSELTTIRLGGPARFLVSCTSPDECRAALALARDHSVPVMVIGGGSNIVFSDEGYPGLVLRVEIPGLRFEDSSRLCHVTVGAGELWDDVVTACVARGLGGIECLAGIPGTAGATPIQNVGAYGQEVRDTIHTVHVLHRETGEEKEFSNTECGLGYRWSRFKGEDTERYIVTGVVFRLEQEARPKIRYPELARIIAQEGTTGMLPSGEPALNQVRKAVLRLRRSKAMVIDPSDPNSRSVGSFFVNPVLEQTAFERVRERWQASGQTDAIPAHPSPGGIKIPAAWLVEHAGFPRGTRRGKIGISEKHALALVNRGGTTRELVALAEEIQNSVEEKFSITLTIEPIIVGYQNRKSRS